MKNIIVSEASTERLRLFAEIYQTRMEAKPFMEIMARYDSMTAAKLEVSEREHAENFIDSGKFDELLHPENYLVDPIKLVSN